jgi:chitodextrinase
VVQYRPSGSTTWTTYAANVTATSVTVMGLLAGTVYSFQVAAVSTGGTGPYSAIVQGETTASAVATVPGQVTGLATGAVTTASIALSWTSTAAATSYIVQYRTHGGSTWNTAASSIAGTSDVVNGLTAGTAYDFQVAATNSAGIGAYSSVVTATTTSSTLALPGAVTGLAVGTATNTTLPLSWTNPASGGAIADITVQYRTPSGTGTWVTASSTVPATQTSFTINGLTAGTGYDVQVFATNASGAGPADVLPDVSTSSASTIPNYYLTNFNNDSLPPNTSYSIAAGGTLNCFVNTNSEGGGSYAFPAAVWFFTTQDLSTIQSVGATINGTGGKETLSSGYAYGWVAPCYVPMPASPGTWYVWAAAVDSNGVIGSTVHGPAFTVTA